VLRALTGMYSDICGLQTVRLFELEDGVEPSCCPTRAGLSAHDARPLELFGTDKPIVALHYFQGHTQGDAMYN
jgi:hypothetical protein